MSDRRPDNQFVHDICTVCDRPIGVEFGGPIAGLATREFLHVDCLQERFECPATGKNCFHKPNAYTMCTKCVLGEPETQEDIREVIWKASQ